MGIYVMREKLLYEPTVHAHTKAGAPSVLCLINVLPLPNDEVALAEKKVAAGK